MVVDENNNRVGLKEKDLAHIDGDLHRAFSIFVFNQSGELLLQRRALEKYHSAGLWSNSCCSHPILNRQKSGEEAKSRLFDEMGFTCELRKVTNITYNLKLKCGMIEHECNDIYQGSYDGEIRPNAEEVCEYRWIEIKTLLEELNDKPELYTEWFKHLLLKTELTEQLALSV